MATSETERLNEMFSEFERCTVVEQKQKIEEMNGIIDEMDKEELKFVFATEMFNKIHQIIEEKKLSMENVILLLKHMGYCIKLKGVYVSSYEKSSLCKRFEKMIIEEEKEKEGKNEKLLVDLCECYPLFYDECTDIPETIIGICGKYLMKAALKKEENEETQKEVEIALMALRNLHEYSKSDKEIYTCEIKEIIQYHQKHHNLTSLAYQTAWQFLISRFYYGEILEVVIANELHFVKEAVKELEELEKCVDWKRKEEGKKEKENKKELLLIRWLGTLDGFLSSCELWNEAYSGLISSITQVLRAAKVNNGGIGWWCINLLKRAVDSSSVKIDDLLKGRAIDAVLEAIQRVTLDNSEVSESMHFFLLFQKQFKKVEDDEIEKEKRKALSKIIEKMEEEGYEDIITSFCELLHFLWVNKCYRHLSLDISDYFVNI